MFSITQTHNECILNIKYYMHAYKKFTTVMLWNVKIKINSAKRYYLGGGGGGVLGEGGGGVNKQYFKKFIRKKNVLSIIENVSFNSDGVCIQIE